MLRKILLIGKRDYIAVVTGKAFLIGLLMTPIIFGGIFLAAGLTRSQEKGQDRKVAVLDHTGQTTKFIIEAAEDRYQSDKTNPIQAQLAGAHYVVESVSPEEANASVQKLALSDRVRKKELFAFLEIGKAALHPKQDKAAGKVLYFSNEGGVDRGRLWLAEVVNTGLRRARLAEMGVDPTQLREALGAVGLDNMTLLTRDEASGVIEQSRKKNDAEGFLIPMILLVLMMLIVLMGAAPMITSVAEDKLQRVFEILLASATPLELIAGKVLASVGCSLTGSVFYVIGGIVALQGMAMTGTVNLWLLPWFFVYLILEVAILSSAGAALGAACSTPRDAQSLMQFIMLPIMLPALMSPWIIQQPNGVLAAAISLFPPFTPLLMMLRQASPGGVPGWQPWVGLAGILLWACATTWAASRIFRVAILMQGQPPRVAELLRWAVRG